MTYIDTTLTARTALQGESAETRRKPLIVVVEDGMGLSESFRPICDCLGVVVESLPSKDDLGPVLRNRNPMAVIAEMDALGQDGCHVLMTVAAYDRDLPTLLITLPDPTLLGAADAVEEVWRLSSVEKWEEQYSVAAIVDFLFRAGRKGCCMRLMTV
jgi:hypothetical protein